MDQKPVSECEVIQKCGHLERFLFAMIFNYWHAWDVSDTRSVSSCIPPAFFLLLCSVADELAVEAPLMPTTRQGNEVTSLEKTNSFWLAKYQ